MNKPDSNILVDQELALLYEEKAKRAAELIIANEELIFQNEEKEKRAAELLIANKELVFQNEEKEKRAIELIAANKELVFLVNKVKKQAAELQVANEEILAFTNISNHHLQEPLRKIQIFASFLKGEHLSEKAKNYSERIYAGAERMQQLIKSLLTYSQIDASGSHFEKTDLNAVIEGIKNELDESIVEKGAVINCDNLPHVYVIPFQFRQVLSDLISNSLKFSRPNCAPLITIKGKIVNSDSVAVAALLPGKNYCHISVQDNGIGFESKYSKLIFEMFEKLYDIETFAGTGMGLTIVKKIVADHGGIITATGKLNEGAIFDIFIPDSQ